MTTVLRFLATFLIAISLTSCAADEDHSFNVMTFNIRYNNPADGPDAWPHRKDIVTSMIRFYDADIVGLQEALKDQLTDLETRLPDYDWYGIGRDDGKEAGEHMAIFYIRDRFELREHGTFWLSETPDTPGLGWDANNVRTVTWCHFRDKRSGKTFYHFNTHFDHRGEEARRQSATLLLEKISAIAGAAPVVVTGDFNAGTETEVYALLTGITGAGSAAPLTDARISTLQPHHGPTGTSTGFEAIRPGRQIDYIFTKGSVTVHRHGFLSDTFDGRFPSDHLPVLAEITIQ